MNSTFLNQLRLNAILLIACAAAIASQIVAEARGTPFSKIIVLGDSLSDTGNFYELSGGFPPEPFSPGRFSNGQVWVEYLALSLGMSIAEADNYAVGGATTGSFNVLNGVAGLTYPGLSEQLEALLNDHPGGLDPDALYTLWIGANDFFVMLETGADPGATFSSAAENITQAVQTLAAAGARHIMVPNLPDIGLTPAGLASGFAPLITELSVAYNNVLSDALQALALGGIDVIEVDTFSTLQAMVERPLLFGFRDVTHSYLPDMQGNAGRFLFWDDVHPTTRGHRVFGIAGLIQLIDHFVRPGHSGQHWNIARHLIRLESRKLE